MSLYSDIEENILERLGQREDARREGRGGSTSHSEHSPYKSWDLFEHYTRVNGNGFNVNNPDDFNFLLEMLVAERADGDSLTEKEIGAIRERFQPKP